LPTQQRTAQFAWLNPLARRLMHHSRKLWSIETYRGRSARVPGAALP